VPHALESAAVGFPSRLLVDIFLDDLPALRFAELTELAALVFYVLPFSLAGCVIVAFVHASGNAQVEGGSRNPPIRHCLNKSAAPDASKPGGTFDAKVRNASNVGSQIFPTSKFSPRFRLTEKCHLLV
jgi:hypothetical protein